MVKRKTRSNRTAPSSRQSHACSPVPSRINVNQAPGSMLGTGNIHSGDQRRAFPALVDLKITLSFTYSSNQHIENNSQVAPVIELFISPSRSPIPSPRPAISSCLRPAALPPPSPSSAEGLTLVPLENKSDRKRDFPQAPASHVPAFQHMSLRPLTPPLPPLPARTVPESKATPLCARIPPTLAPWSTSFGDFLFYNLSPISALCWITATSIQTRCYFSLPKKL